MAGGPEQCSICLEALDGGEVSLACGHRLHAACLAQMAGALGTATTRRGALTACPNCRTLSRVAPVAPVVETFSVGDRVLTLYRHQWYPGVVRGVINSGHGYEITWDDGDEGDVFAASVRAEAPAALVPPVRTVTTTTTGQSEGGDSSNDDDGDDWSPRAPERRRGGPAAAVDGGTRTTSSRFWGVSWKRKDKKWHAYYNDADGKDRSVGFFDDEEEAARAVNKAIRDAGLEGKRRTNAVDATGALVPKSGHHNARDRSAVVAPDPSRDLTATTSKFWGVTWNKRDRRWQARYKDAHGKRRNLGLHDTQEDAAHAVNAAIRRAGLEGKRRTNPVVDGALVPKQPGAPTRMNWGSKKRDREEPAVATPSTRARRRQRRADE
jgi:hypothetical protein